ncbi:MAG: hypothetical protein WCL30_02750 [Pseudomonadota bacterium]
MTKKVKIILLVLAELVLLAAAVHFYNYNPSPAILENIKQPEWLAEVDNAPTINNADELGTLWRSVPRCCGDDPGVKGNFRIFYKACYNAMARHPKDDNLVVDCLNLMLYSLESGDAAKSNQFQEIILNKYYNHKDSLKNCANCDYADTVARIAKDFAYYHFSEHRYDIAINILEDILDKRGQETSPWIRIEILTDLGNLYLKAAINDAGKQRMQAAYEEFAAKKHDETIESRFAAFEQVYNKLQEHK